MFSQRDRINTWKKFSQISEDVKLTPIDKLINSGEKVRLAKLINLHVLEPRIETISSQLIDIGEPPCSRSELDQIHRRIDELGNLKM